MTDNNKLICDYCYQPIVKLGYWHLRSERGGSDRKLCEECMIRVVDKALGTPEHKTDEMEKMFVIE
jgi:hypothetical protein